jgi:protein SCO1/2
VTGQSLDDKIYVADFIFLSCPTICPRITQAMRKVYTKYAGEDRIVFLSHTIDPQHDTIPRLRQYAQGLGVDSRKWHFLTGPQDSILNLAEHGYFTAAAPDSEAPGGFAHGGGLLLVDRHKHIRGVYNGTDSAETERLIRDIPVLLREQF